MPGTLCILSTLQDDSKVRQKCHFMNKYSGNYLITVKGSQKVLMLPLHIIFIITIFKNKSGSGEGTRTPDTRIMIPLL